MQQTRTFYAKRNIFFGMCNKLFAILLPFVIRTIVIRRFGAEYLGLSSLFSSILQAFSMAELGFSSAIVFRMYKPMAEHDEEKICALLAFYRKVYRTVGTFILVAGILLMPFIKYLINGSWPSDINIYVLYVITLSGTVISYYGVAYKSSLLSVAQRQDIISNVDTILVLLKSLIQIVILLVFKNYYAYAIWTPIFTLANNLIISQISKKLYPNYVCRGEISRSEVKELTQQIKGIAIGKVGSISRNSFDSIALSMFSGLVEVSIYSNYYYVFSAISGVLYVIIQAITGGIGNSLATESNEKNYHNFLKFNYYYAWLSGWCTVCLACLYQPFMRLWVGDSLTAGYSTMILFCVYFYITQMGQIRAMYGGAAGIWWEFRYFVLAEAIANPILNFTLGYFLGMNGILLATIISVSICSIVGLGYKTMKFCFHRGSAEYFMLMCVYAVVTFIAAAFTEFVCQIYSGSLISEFIIRGCICVIVPNLIFALFSVIDRRHRDWFFAVRNFGKK